MQKHLLLYILSAFILGRPVVAQNLKAEIEGKVTAEGEGVSFAAIGLKGTSHGTVADENGNFALKNIPAGNYELVVNAVGFQPYQKRVGVGAEKVNLKIELQKATRQLQEVVVSGTMKETYVMQSPVHVEVYTPKLFQKTPRPAFLKPCKW